MYSTKGYSLTKKEYDYLLPAIRSKLLYSNDRHSFIGNLEDLTDMLNRLKGLYDNYDEIKSMTVYRCTQDRSLNAFRKEFLKIAELE